MNKSYAHMIHREREMKMSWKEKYENFGNNFVSNTDTPNTSKDRVTEYVLNIHALKRISKWKYTSVEITFPELLMGNKFLFFCVHVFHEREVGESNNKKYCQLPIASCIAHHRMPIVESKKEIISSSNCKEIIFPLVWACLVHVASICLHFANGTEEKKIETTWQPSSRQFQIRQCEHRRTSIHSCIYTIIRYV